MSFRQNGGSRGRATAAIEPGDDATSDAVNDGGADPRATWATGTWQSRVSKNTKANPKPPGQKASDLGLFEPPIGIEPMTYSLGCGSSGGTSGGSGNGAVEVAGFVDAVSFSVEVPGPVCLEVAVAAKCS